MDAQSFVFRIDAAFSEKDSSSVVLMPDGGEYIEALARLAALGPDGPAGRSVPDEVYLHLFANELAERMGECLQTEPTSTAACLVLPFWPEALFQAADLPVHGAREIQALYPRPREVRYVPRPPEATAKEAARVLGVLRFDPEKYGTLMRILAEEKGWKTEAPPS